MDLPKVTSFRCFTLGLDLKFDSDSDLDSGLTRPISSETRSDSAHANSRRQTLCLRESASRKNVLSSNNSRVNRVLILMGFWPAIGATSNTFPRTRTGSRDSAASQTKSSRLVLNSLAATLISASLTC